MALDYMKDNAKCPRMLGVMDKAGHIRFKSNISVIGSIIICQSSSGRML